MRPMPSDTPALLGRWVNRAAALCIFLSLAACSGGDGALTAPSTSPVKLAASTVVVPGIIVTGITKVSETRVSRTVYDYVFQVSFKNNGSIAQSGVAATLTGTGPGATIQDGSVIVGDLVAGGTATPPDTITIRQDRTLPFSEGMLIWAITTNSSTPPPGTVAGLDVDNDGVRDDVQAFIITKFPNDPPIRDAVLQLAKSYQAVATSNNQNQLDAAEISRREAAVCLSDRTSPSKALELNASLRAVQLNTDARYAAELAFRDQLAGKSVVVQLTTLGGTCK